MNEIFLPPHQIFRVRRETRRRSLAVAAVEQLTPKMRRIRFASADLHDFASDASDDHIKLFFPMAEPQENDKPFCMRDYTPRAFDPAAGTLTIDFALHEAGPATRWALSAQPGDALEIGGPRGSLIVPDDFDWYLLIGDETALPAIGRRVESLRPDTKVTTIVAVDGTADHQHFVTQANWKPVWVHRAGSSADDAALLRAALAERSPLPEGDGYIWIAAEAHAARMLRNMVVDTLGHPKAWVKAAGYWTKGTANVHETIGD
jgi:NADPH-dependent ferric siderophore reductase